MRLMKIRCPDDCNYRPKDALVCGFCLKKILQKLDYPKEGSEESGQKEQNQSSGETY